jgi:hypothetical protein
VTITVGTKPWRRSSFRIGRTAAALSRWGWTRISRTSHLNLWGKDHIRHNLCTTYQFVTCVSTDLPSYSASSGFSATDAPVNLAECKKFSTDRGSKKHVGLWAVGTRRRATSFHHLPGLARSRLAFERVKGYVITC